MHRVIVLSHQSSTGSLLRSVGAAAKWQLFVNSSWADLRQQVWTAQTARTTESAAAVVLDLATVALAGLTIERALGEIKSLAPDAPVALIASGALHLDAVDERWASTAGAALLVPALSALRWERSGARLQAFINGSAESVDSDSQKRVLPYVLAAQRLERNNDALVNLAAVENSGVDLPQLARRIGRSGGVEIKNRTYHLRSYPQCFLAKDGIDWIAKALGIDQKAAITVGCALQATGLIYHVAREQLFSEEFLFFRVATTPSNFVLADHVSACRSKTGFERRDRDYLGTSYPRCFVGSEAAASMQSRGMSFNEAMSVGERMLRLSIFSHVLDEHPFRDAKLFYRFGDERA
ncbi:MAG: hypothetical protein EAZ24_15545 [Burkholderiales bacterium]|nr:MAG: hypothetical protein EAZ43_04380 [Betaproteobacteria bacterium]TAG67448.1 MAG: hypothetical protein EAZ24_15545 [Burkholderiales bacterium]